MRWASGATETWTFDAHNRPRSVATTSATGLVRAASWTWRRDGLLGRVDTAFGPSTPTSSVYGTDRFGRQSHESHGLVGLPAMVSGAVRSRALSRYAERGTAWATLTLDAADNWRTLTTQNEEIKDITAGSDNRLLRFGAPIPSDAAGRVLGDEHGAHYVYDGLGHLSTATADGHALHFAYDGLGRLATQRSADGEEVQQHLGGVLLRQVVDGAGRTYVPGPTSTPVALVGAGRRLGLHHGLGQRIEAVTGEDGGLIERVSYSAFGSPSFFKADGSEVGGSTVGLGVLVSGQAYVPELGLHRLGARWYQPRWGRFLTPDPAGFVDGPHRFAFVGNQPLAFVDPSGLGKGGGGSSESDEFELDGRTASLFAMSGLFGGTAIRANLRDVQACDALDDVCAVQRAGEVTGMRGTVAAGDGTRNIAQTATEQYVTWSSLGLGASGQAIDVARLVSLYGFYEIHGQSNGDAGQEAGVAVMLSALPLVGELRGLRTAVLAGEPGVEVVQRGQGVVVARFGDTFVKFVDESAGPFFRWLGGRSIREQQKALTKLGDMAAPHVFDEQALIIATQDVGRWAGGWRAFVGIWARGSGRLGTVLNDIRPRNVGANGLIFDPAWDVAARWIVRAAIAGVSASVALYGYAQWQLAE